MKTITSRDFNQDVGSAKRAAREQQPVIITERGRPSHVLLSYEAYRQLKGPAETICERLYMPGVADIEFDLPDRDALAVAAAF